MKRIVLLIVALAIVAPFSAVAEETYLQPGNLLVSIGVGAGFGWGFTLSAYPGVELMFAKVKIADAVPLDFGVAAKGLFGFSTFLGYSYIHLGAGVFATVHWGPRGMSWEANWLDPFDFWWALGIAASGHIATSGGAWPGSILSFASAAGLNYFLNDRFALTVAASYWGYGGGYIGILYKLGKGETLIEVE